MPFELYSNLHLATMEIVCSSYCGIFDLKVIFHEYYKGTTDHKYIARKIMIVLEI